MTTDKALIQRYKTLVSERYQLTAPSQWKQRDLEYLIQLINEKSGVRLSLSTMKRLVKEDFAQLPHTSTLDALVSILDFSDWRQFSQAHQMTKKKSTRPVLMVSLSTALVGLILFFVIPGFEQTDEEMPIINGPVTFSADKTVSQGVPNTVVFNYDVQHVEADSFSIQQSWNVEERMPINPTEHYYSRIYYYPGYHKAKLIANDSIIAKRPIHIVTDGWEPIVRFDFYKSLPTYVKGDFVQNGTFGVSENDLLTNDISSDGHMIMTYSNIRDFGNLSSDDFYFSIRMKNDSLRNIPCPEMWFTIHTEKHIFYTPFTIRGCEANLEAKYGEKRFKGSNSDMSPFGGDVYQWQHLELVVKDKEVTLLNNGVELMKTSFEEDFGRIVGLACSFNGLGSIDHVSLGHDEEHLVYEEEFDLSL